MRKVWTVDSLAAASELDVEQVLVALWSEGIEYPLEPSSRIWTKDARSAERATGVLGSAQKRVLFWQQELSMSRGELATLLTKLDVPLAPNATTMPKGAIKRLRAHFGITVRAAAEAAATVDVGRDADPLPQASPYEWKPPGSARECAHLSAEEILQVHEALTADFADTDDPISPPGVKSMALLESAAGRPSTGYGDQRKYPTVESAAAALLHSLVQNHPFHNGNKRTALVATLVLLDRHNLLLESSQEELFRFMIRVAAHDLLASGFRYDQVADREVGQIAEWIFTRTRHIRREERAITWRELSRKLRSHGCDVSQYRGEKWVIRRKVQGRKRLLGGYKTELLETYFLNTGDGREVPKAMVRRIRQDLYLDPDHGVDAEVFYGDMKGADFFIVEYSQLLRRLARV